MSAADHPSRRDVIASLARIGLGTAVLFGAYPDLSTIGVAAAMPVLAWELSLALWMIIKGFRTVTPDQTPTSVRPTAPIAA